jgi:hypothetical protein
MKIRPTLAIIIAAGTLATLAGCSAFQSLTSGTADQQDAAVRDVVTELRTAGAELRDIAEQTRADAQATREAAEAAGDTQTAQKAAKTEQKAADVAKALDKAKDLVVENPQGPAGIDPAATTGNIMAAIPALAPYASIGSGIVLWLWGLAQRRAARVIVNSIDAQRNDPQHGPKLREAMAATKQAARLELSRSRTARDLLESERLK